MNLTQMQLRLFNMIGAASRVPDSARMDMAKQILEDLLSEVHAPGNRHWVQPDPDHGYVNIKQGETTLARTKSINVARTIRDALNAPDALVGQTVEVDGSEYTADSGGRKVLHGEPKIVRGVVMALVQFGGSAGLVLRLSDNQLDTFPVQGARIVEHHADPEPEPWEP